MTIALTAHELVTDEPANTLVLSDQSQIIGLRPIEGKNMLYKAPDTLVLFMAENSRES